MSTEHLPFVFVISWSLPFITIMLWKLFLSRLNSSSAFQNAVSLFILLKVLLLTFWILDNFYCLIAHAKILWISPLCLRMFGNYLTPGQHTSDIQISGLQQIWKDRTDDKVPGLNSLYHIQSPKHQDWSLSTEPEVSPNSARLPTYKYIPASHKKYPF